MSNNTCIVGSGHGANHSWERGFTPQVGSAPNEQRYTYYQCRHCGWLFKHHYNLVPNIFLAMKQTGVPEFCTLATGSDEERKEDNDDDDSSNSVEEKK
jgi:hypothetical protein